MRCDVCVSSLRKVTQAVFIFVPCKAQIYVWKRMWSERPWLFSVLHTGRSLTHTQACTQSFNTYFMTFCHFPHLSKKTLFRAFSKCQKQSHHRGMQMHERHWYAQANTRTQRESEALTVKSRSGNSRRSWRGSSLSSGSSSEITAS